MPMAVMTTCRWAGYTAIVPNDMYDPVIGPTVLDPLGDACCPPWGWVNAIDEAYSVDVENGTTPKYTDLLWLVCLR